MQPCASRVEVRRELAGAVNMLHPGGLPTGDGARVQAGMLRRSAPPQFLSVDDAQLLAAEPGLVLDLRFEGEMQTERYGARGATDVRTENAPIVDAGGTRVEMDFRAGASGDQDHLAAHYIRYVEPNAASVVSAVRLMVDSGGPILVHFPAGKDRTAVLVALVLSVLGVPAELIVADYARTAENLPDIATHLSTAPSYATTIGRRPLDDPFAQSPPQAMRRFLS